MLENHTRARSGTTCQIFSHNSRPEDKPSAGRKEPEQKNPPTVEAFDEEQKTPGAQGSTAQPLSPSSDWSSKDYQPSGTHQPNNNNKRNNPKKGKVLIHNENAPKGDVQQDTNSLAMIISIAKAWENQSTKPTTTKTTWRSPRKQLKRTFTRRVSPPASLPQGQ